jgi:hypothetical protein
MEIILKNVPMYFENVYEPSVSKGAKAGTLPAYSARYAIEPGSANDKLINETILKVATDKWGDKTASVLAKIIADKNSMYIEGEYKDKDGETYEGFEGMFSIGTRSEKLKPRVSDKFNRVVESGDPGAPYGGCVVHAAIDIWAQDNSYGRRINAVTQGVMFVADGTPVGGGRPASDSTFAGLAAEPSTEDFV